MTLLNIHFHFVGKTYVIEEKGSAFLNSQGEVPMSETENAVTLYASIERETYESRKRQQSGILKKQALKFSHHLQ